MDGDLIFVQSTDPAGFNIITDFGFFPRRDMTLLHTHGPEKCQGRPCCIHHPSNHHMVHWPQNWRGDRGIMERTCSHGVGHPDPDDLRIQLKEDSGIHGCDGCCNTEIVEGLDEH
jgi:hypothetical protein